LIHISISRLINANSLRRFKKIITEVKRLTSKEGANLKTIKIVIDDRLKFEKLIRDRQIQIMGMLAKPVSEWVFKDRPNQCFKCQKFGHSAQNCKSHKQVCLRCSKEHSHSDCNMDKVKGPFKCGNCGGDHAAVDRSCPALKKYMQKRQDKCNTNEHDFTRIFSAGLTYGTNSTQLELRQDRQDQTPVDNVIQFIYEVINDFGNVQTDINSRNATSFLNLVKHYFEASCQGRINTFIKNDQTENQVTMNEQAENV
jgi:hypothetical protein